MPEVEELRANTSVVAAETGVSASLFLSTDRSGKVIEVDGVVSLLGRRRSELIGRPVVEALRHEPELAQLLLEAASGHTGETEVLFGGTRLSARFGARIGDDGQPFGAWAVLVELAPGRADQVSLLEHVFEQAPGVMWTTDLAMKVTSAVGRLEELPGYAHRGVIGLGIAELLNATGSDDPTVARHRAALAGRSSSFIHNLRGREYAMKIDPLRDPAGVIVGCIGVAMDVTERRAAERELGESEARLAEAQRVAHIGSWEWDLQSNRVVWSDELYRIYGRSPGGFTGTYESYLAAIHPEDVERVKNEIFDALRLGRPFDYTHRVVRPDGSLRMVRARGEVVRKPDGGNRMIGVSWDVTEQWETDKALREATSLLQSSFEATAEGLLVVDPEGRARSCNQRFLSMWGITPELVARGSGEALTNFLADQLERPQDYERRLRELGHTPEAESSDTFRLKDRRVFEGFSRPQRLDGAVVGRVWSFRDITDHERLLERALFLADASRLLASLDMEKALEAVAHQAIHFFAEACAVDLFGERGPRRLVSIAREGSRLQVKELPRPVFAGQPAVQTLEGQNLLAAPILAHGELLGAFTFADAAQRAYTQADLELVEELARRAALSIETARVYRKAEEALRARDEFLTVAAHEIRIPITAIHLAVQNLRARIAPNESVKRHFEIVEREDRRLARLVDELLNVGKIRAGGLSFQFEQVDLVQVAREAATRLSFELSRSHSSLSVTSDGPVVGTWDHARVFQVVLNLLSNAVKFGMGRPIEVRLGQANGWARLSVQDHGAGIRREHFERIFEPFERAVSSRHYGGLGLGLFIVRTIVQGFGGRIAIDSEPGQGATFTVELPQSRNGGVLN